MVKVTRATTQKDTKKELRTKSVLSRLKHKSEEEQASILAEEHNLPYVDLNLVPLSGDDIAVISEEESRAMKVGIIQRAGKKVRLAIVDPTDQTLLEHIKTVYEKENRWDVSVYVVSQSSMERIWEKYRETPLLDNLNLLHMSLSGEDLQKFETDFGDLLELKRKIHEIPTSQIITTILAGGVQMKASDIHFESQEKEVRLRFRIDGILQDIGSFPHDVYRFVLSRIKIMGKMKINVRDAAQDGHFSITVADNRVDMRINIIPGKYGENIVMRILNQASIMIGVEDLGLRGLAHEIIQKEIEKPNGMILTTGPTGSGKTTTLYALINHLNTSDVKIITIEDPVEYEIKGITQTEISREHGYTFASGLRAIVRQDPDVVLVGEIRDEETSEIAVNAALTGHLVLSTLHTNNAPASIPRLMELGIKPTLIAPSVNCFIAQRLVRKLCPDCREAYQPAEETAETIKKILAIISPKAKVDVPKEINQFYKPVGCPKCNNLGYKGRIGIFEVMIITEKIEKLILDMAGEGEITRAAMEDGMISMAQDGILKAIDGITTIDEVWRATGQEEFLEDMYYKLMEQSYSHAVDISQGALEEAAPHVTSFEELKQFMESTRKKDLLRTIFASALLLEANDIYIEPRENSIDMRLRIDGALHSIGSLSLDNYPNFLSEAKYVSGLASGSRESVSEGRFVIQLEKPIGSNPERSVGVQISFVQGGFGENIVMHLMNKSAIARSLDELGIRKQNLDLILKAVEKPRGMFIVTGPVGAGKSTTLYSLLRILNKPDVKIITLEDPIEYRIEGILQTQINPQDHRTMPEALRSLIRQNPDILMIGKIDNYEVTEMAIQSTLAGHLILSTLDSGETEEAIQKISNIGVQPEDFAAATNAILSQRLVRQLCSCKKEVPVTPEDKKRIESILKTISPKSGIEIPEVSHVYQPVGCPKCNSIGFHRRIVASEILYVTEEIRELFYQHVSPREIRQKAIDNGMITLAQDGILKVVEGHTTLDEVERVIRE